MWSAFSRAPHTAGSKVGGYQPRHRHITTTDLGCPLYSLIAGAPLLGLESLDLPNVST